MHRVHPRKPTMRSRIHILAGSFAAVAIVSSCSDTTYGGTTTGNGNPQPTTISYTATLTGASERPTANNSTATGTFTGTLDPATNVFTWTVVYSGLTTPATLSHIHFPATADQAAAAIFDFSKIGA